MKLKEYISYTFSNGKLEVFDHGHKKVSQPFNSETGSPFRDVDAALAWLVEYYPEFFTPSQ